MSAKLEHQPKRPLAILAALIDRILPRALRRGHMKRLNNYESVSEFVPESLVAVVTSYKVQAVNAFNKTAFVAELAVLAFCFATASMALHSYVIIGAVLGTLIMRDAFRHPFAGSAVNPVVEFEEKNRPAWQYLLVWFGDAVAATVALFVAETLMLKVAPSHAMSGDLFRRGALICLPILATLRMTLRGRLGGQEPFQGSNKSAATIYRMTRHITTIWMTVCIFTIRSNAEVLPVYYQGQKGLMVLVPIVTFALWFRLQQDPFARDNNIRTALGDGAEAERRQRIQYLMTGINKEDALYPAYVVLQGLMFVAMAAPLAFGLWPWLSGQDAGVNYFRLVFNLISFATLSLSWNYIKTANSAAANALGTRP